MNEHIYVGILGLLVLGYGVLAGYWSSNMHWVVSIDALWIHGLVARVDHVAPALGVDLRSFDWESSGRAPALRCVTGYTTYDTAGFIVEARRVADREEREQERENGIEPFQCIICTTTCRCV